MTAASPPATCSAARSKLDERLARVREGKRSNSQAAMQTFESSRPTVGAQALGIARAAYEYALEYAKEREQFGRKIIENQAIAFTLARMKMEIDAAAAARLARIVDGPQRRALRERGGLDEQAEGRARSRCGSPSARSRSSAATATRASIPVERWHRDAKIYDIFEGTAEIQQLVIARAISGMQIK